MILLSSEGHENIPNASAVVVEVKTTVADPAKYLQKAVLFWGHASCVSGCYFEVRDFLKFDLT